MRRWLSAPAGGLLAAAVLSPLGGGGAGLLARRGAGVAALGACRWTPTPAPPLPPQQQQIRLRHSMPKLKQQVRPVPEAPPARQDIPAPGTPEFAAYVEAEVDRVLEESRPYKHPSRYGRYKGLPKKEVVLAHKRKWHITAGDRVIVRGTGKDGGKTGVVLKVNRKKDEVLVENVNIVKRVLKDAAGQPRELHRERPIHYSMVNLIDPVDGRACRIRWGFLEDGTRVRVSARSGQIIPKPPLRYKRDTSVYDSDTPADIVLKRTFEGR
jgi:large subunit ribosomal protein L24